MRIAPLLAVLAIIACSPSGSGSGGASLQSACVRNQLHVGRSLPDGAECYNVGYTDCGAGWASECTGVCAFDVCQSTPCTSDATCPGFCKELVVGDIGYGKWCDKACTHGTLECPCDQGACHAPDEHWQVTCDAKGVCAGADTCTSGCRVRSASGVSSCCGGALCSGNCAGTPCCH